MDSGLPMPKVVADVGPGGRYITNQLAQAALQNQLLQNQQLQATVPYAGPTAVANAMSKIAFSNLGPYQTMTKMLGDPQYVATLRSTPQGEAKYQAQVAQLANMPANPYGQFNALMAQAQQQQNRPSLGNQLLGAIGRKIFGIGQQPQQPTQNAQGNNSLSPVAMPQQYSQQDNVLNQPSTSIPTEQQVNPENVTTPTQGMPGVQPNLPLKTLQSEETAKKQGDLNAVAMDKLEDAAGNAADAAITSKNALDSMVMGYNNTERKGGYFGIKGYEPSGGDPWAQMFDSGKQQQLSSLERGLQSGHITNMDYQLGKDLIPSRTSDPAFFNIYKDFHNALNARTVSFPTFVQQGRQNNLTAPQIKTLWNDFGYLKPLYDLNNKSVNSDNSTSWSEILSPKIRNYLLSGKGDITQMRLVDGKLYHKINGKWNVVE